MTSFSLYSIHTKLRILCQKVEKITYCQYYGYRQLSVHNANEMVVERDLEAFRLEYFILYRLQMVFRFQKVFTFTQYQPTEQRERQSEKKKKFWTKDTIVCATYPRPLSDHHCQQFLVVMLR